MMKSLFLDKMEEAGDAVITYRSPVSKKLKYNVCTLEFNSCDYIKEKNQKKKAKTRKTRTGEGACQFSSGQYYSAS